MGGVIGGLAHLQGVIANATTRNHAYDFPSGALLLPVTIPLIPVTPDNAGGPAFLSALDLAVLAWASRRLEVG